MNNELSTYLDRIEVEHVLGAPNNPQSYGVIEAFNKIVQKLFQRHMITLRKIKMRNLI